MPTIGPSAVSGLPPLCYARQPSTGATVLIVRGQAGYHPVESCLTAEQLNTALTEPPTRQQVQAMLLGSMFGWQVPEADPARHAEVNAHASDAAAEPLPLFPVVASWGGPDTPFRLKWRSRIHPGSRPDLDLLWACAGQHLGLYGWLRVADQRVRQAFGHALLDLPPRDWQAMYADRVPPTEAVDVAIDEHAAQQGTAPVVALASVSPTA